MSSYASSDFYWADWEVEPTLRVSSLAAQGLWLRICARCHHSPRRGYFLLPNGEPPTLAKCAELFGKPEAEIAPLIEELIANKVCDRNEAGVLINRRMLKEEARRAKKGAKKGAPEADEGALKTYKTLAAANLDGACREALKRANAAERQRRRRANKRKSAADASRLSTAAVTPESRLSTVTVAPCHVTESRLSTVTSVTVTRDSVTDGVTPDEEKQRLMGRVTPAPPPRTRARASSFLLPPSDNPLPEKPRPEGAPHAGTPATLTGGVPAVAPTKRRREPNPPGPEEVSSRVAKLATERAKLHAHLIATGDLPSAGEENAP